MIRLAPLMLCALLAGCSAEMKREVCGDGIDNDNNGLTDCDDRDCAGQPACIPPDYGNCAKCSQTCSAQSACVTSYLDERPIPLCVNGRCSAVEKFIQPKIDLDTSANWQGLTFMPRSGSTRFIKKFANDGSPVTCATVFAVASDRNAAGAIEASSNLIVQGLDVTPVNTMAGQVINYTFVNTQTGGDYLIWTELWGGPVGSTTKLPTGRRFGYGCFESGPQVAPLVPEDNCPSTTSDAGVCRRFRLTMPPPEMP
ncbi:MAG: hypothetical protein Q8N23_25970 [Archangium sp.]|nr:hypothetical protein [Archangium sp.]MDP3156149.1 hypothetical protein [Archangium sp.]MDP3571486.1 hypothetical protein [Archangium sp.]